jgi:hypothetical protein
MSRLGAAAGGVAVAVVALAAVGLLWSLSTLLTGPLVLPAAVVLVLVVLSVVAGTYLGVSPLSTLERRYW